MPRRLRIGSGAGFSGDRLEPAVVLAERGALDYLVLECLAERTIALAQLRRKAKPTEGYDPLLKRRVEMPVIVESHDRKANLFSEDFDALLVFALLRRFLRRRLTPRLCFESSSCCRDYC